MSQSGSLAGLSIVNTRAPHQVEDLTSGLAAHGATVFHYPAIRIAPPADTAALDAALIETLRGDYDWLVLTSANTVESLAQRLREMNAQTELAASPVRLAAIGTATAESAAQQLGIQAALIPDEFVAESLAASLSLRPGERVFLPQSEIARSLLSDAFQTAGATVTQVVAYRTLMGQGGDPVPQLFWEGCIDAVTFTSPSTVHNFLKRLKVEGGGAGMLVDVVVACIGPQCADAARSHDLPVRVVPVEHTIGGLVAALCSYFQRDRSHADRGRQTADR